MARALPFHHAQYSHVSTDIVIAASIESVSNHHRRAIAALLAVCVFAGCSQEGSESPRRAAAATRDSLHTQRTDGPVVIPLSATVYVGGDVPASGSVSGVVRLRSPIAPLAPMETGNDRILCGPSMPDESVREKTGGLEGAVVWLDGVHRGKTLPLERRLELEIDHCKLQPRIQATMLGSAVNIIGHDDNRSHLRFVAMGEPKPRAAVLMGGGEQVIPTELPFTAPGLVYVSDADHAWSHAFIAVFDHPYYAVTSPAGAFVIDGVPPGVYTLRAWHERTGIVTQRVQVGAGGAVKVELALSGK